MDSKHGEHVFGVFECDPSLTARLSRHAVPNSASEVGSGDFSRAPSNNDIGNNIFLSFSWLRNRVDFTYGLSDRKV